MEVSGSRAFIRSAGRLKGPAAYWYHSHAQGTTADGVLGPLIIHSPKDPLKRGQDYEDDQVRLGRAMAYRSRRLTPCLQVVVLADWFHNTSEVIIGALLTPQVGEGACLLCCGD